MRATSRTTPSSASRPAGRVDCNQSAMAGFAWLAVIFINTNPPPTQRDGRILFLKRSRKPGSQEEIWSRAERTEWNEIACTHCSPKGARGDARQTRLISLHKLLPVIAHYCLSCLTESFP